MNHDYHKMMLSFKKFNRRRLLLFRAGALVILFVFAVAYFTHQSQSPTRTVSFTHKFFYKSEDNIKATLTYQKSQWHTVSTSSDRGNGAPCSFIQSSNSDLTISIGTSCETPQQRAYNNDAGEIIPICQTGENKYDPSGCDSQAKKIQTIYLSTTGHQYTPYEPLNNSQPIDLAVFRQSTDHGKTYRYWLTLEEITVDYVHAASGGATSLDSYVSEPEVVKAIDVLRTIKSD